MKYSNYQRNHAVISGREKVLEDFVNQGYKGMRHKAKNAISSHSEDALTWTCFEMLRHLPLIKKISVLDEILEDAYQGKCDFKFKDRNYSERQIEIFVGKSYTGHSTKESTEVDASIELPDKLIFVEAKLYSSISLADAENRKPHDQIARKLRVGLDSAKERDFYFIFLDIAPEKHLMKRETKKKASLPKKGGFYEKWKSAWWFNYYKRGWKGSRKPLREVLKGVRYESEKSVADNMGWLTWSDLFKDILRGMIN